MGQPATRRRRSGDDALAHFGVQIARQFVGAKRGSSVAELLDRLAPVPVLAGRSLPMASRGVAEPIARALVQVRLAWCCADERLRRLLAERDRLPPANTPLGAVLRRALPDPTELARYDATWRPVEEVLSGVDALVQRARASGFASAGLTHPYAFDCWLGSHDPSQRRQAGVYYTPPELAGYLVRRVDETLRTQWGLADGLADSATWRAVSTCPPPGPLPGDGPVAGGLGGEHRFIRILDPAAGTGSFLVAVIDRIQANWERRALAAGQRAGPSPDAWDDYVQTQLLPRLVGQEIELASAAVAWLRVAERLVVGGFRWPTFTDIPIRLRDSLAEPQAASRAAYAVSGRATDLLAGEGPVTVVLGNPPFSALTAHRQPWIDERLKSSELAGQLVGSYFEVDGQPLREKKLWLHDAYVQFWRLAQWHIEAAGCGVVGYVTNHGYLDNLTFRGMRCSLLRSFDQISVLDLHGNQKKHEVAPPGVRDENVFGIAAGVAVSILSKSPRPASALVEYAELWGRNAAKRQALADESCHLERTVLTPSSPLYLLVPRHSSTEIEREYEIGYALTDVMPVHSSVAVTARDGLAVAFTAEELLERMTEFCDPQRTDDSLRRSHLPATRSSRYPPGETRSWKVGPAREAARAAGDLSHCLRPCQYRPFDRRILLWADWLIDWPRHEVMRHMSVPGNRALVTRRQMLPGRDCNFFFVTDTVAIDGLLRSDNRGNESFFPLLLDESPGIVAPGGRFNLAQEFVGHCERQWSWRWQGADYGDLEQTMGAPDLFALMYAQFHASAYRHRYQDCLRRAFPRVFLPAHRELAKELCRLGRQLVDRHVAPASPSPPTSRLIHSPAGVSGAAALDSRVKTPHEPGSASPVVAGRYPYLDGSGIHLAPDWHVPGEFGAEWQYRVGGHQVCRKWLRARRGRPLSGTEQIAFCHIVDAITETIALTARIDDAIARAGGWPAAFVGRSGQRLDAVQLHP